MNSKILIVATTLVALVGAGSALAQEATQDFPDARALSSQPRAAVTAELQAGRHDTSGGYGEASPAPAARSTMTMNQVRAETQEARRLGLVGASNEGEIRIATPAELQAIQRAGMAAVSASVAQAAR